MMTKRILQPKGINFSLVRSFVNTYLPSVGRLLLLSYVEIYMENTNQKTQLTMITTQMPIPKELKQLTMRATTQVLNEASPGAFWWTI